MKSIRVGVDLAKSVVQVHGVDGVERAVCRRQVRRGSWLKALEEQDAAEPPVRETPPGAPGGN